MPNPTKEHYDFSCWVVKYGRISINGKVYQKNSLANNDGMTVPLLWCHNHSDPEFVIGRALLENHEDGVFAYGILNDTPYKEAIVYAIQNRGSLSISPFINQVRTDEKSILYGVIREVSLVLDRVDPDEAYHPVLRVTTNA